MKGDRYHLEFSIQFLGKMLRFCVDNEIEGCYLKIKNEDIYSKIDIRKDWKASDEENYTYTVYFHIAEIDTAARFCIDYKLQECFLKAYDTGIFIRKDVCRVEDKESRHPNKFIDITDYDSV